MSISLFSVNVCLTAATAAVLFSAIPFIHALGSGATLAVIDDDSSGTVCGIVVGQTKQHSFCTYLASNSVIEHIPKEASPVIEKIPSENTIAVVQTASLENSGDHDQCASGRVFVYDLPRTSNQEILENCDISFSSISGGRNYFCGLRSGNFSLLCWHPVSSNSTIFESLKMGKIGYALADKKQQSFDLLNLSFDLGISGNTQMHVKQMKTNRRKHLFSRQEVAERKGILFWFRNEGVHKYQARTRQPQVSIKNDPEVYEGDW